MSTEQPSTIAGFATNMINLIFLVISMKPIFRIFKSVTVDDVKRVLNKYLLGDNLRVMVVGKGQDILTSLEEMPYDIMYFDKNGEPTSRPDFSTRLGITVETVLNKYIEAIGKRESRKCKCSKYAC